MEFRPFVPGRHHPRLHVIPEAIERDVDRTDLLAGPAARAFPRVPREFLAGFHMAAEQQVQRTAHLVLPEREDPAAGRRALPARLLVRGANRDAVAAHRARVDIFLNGRHLCEARHPVPPTRLGAQLRELGLLPAAHFLEGDFDPHLRHRGARQIVEGQALHDGPDRAREGVRLPPDLRAQGTWPPQNPMDFWMRPRGYQDLPLVAKSRGPDGSDAPAELLLRRLGHHLGRPGWLPDDVHDRLLDALELFELSLYVLVDVCRSGASGGGG